MTPSTENTLPSTEDNAPRAVLAPLSPETQAVFETCIKAGLAWARQNHIKMAGTYREEDIPDSIEHLQTLVVSGGMRPKMIDSFRAH